jgi:hypothetical protein
VTLREGVLTRVIGMFALRLWVGYNLVKIVKFAVFGQKQRYNRPDDQLLIVLKP